MQALELQWKARPPSSGFINKGDELLQDVQWGSEAKHFALISAQFAST